MTVAGLYTQCEHDAFGVQDGSIVILWVLNEEVLHVPGVGAVKCVEIELRPAGVPLQKRAGVGAFSSAFI